MAACPSSLLTRLAGPASGGCAPSPQTPLHSETELARGLFVKVRFSCRGWGLGQGPPVSGSSCGAGQLLAVRGVSGCASGFESLPQRSFASSHLPAFSVLVPDGCVAARVMCTPGPPGPPTPAELSWGSPCLGTRFLTLCLASCAVRWWGGHHLVPGVEMGSVPDPCGPGFKSLPRPWPCDVPSGPCFLVCKRGFMTENRGAEGTQSSQPGV